METKRSHIWTHGDEQAAAARNTSAQMLNCSQSKFRLSDGKRRHVTGSSHGKWCFSAADEMCVPGSDDDPDLCLIITETVMMQERVQGLPSAGAGQRVSGRGRRLEGVLPTCWSVP